MFCFGNMSSAAARQRLCRQHFTAANERIKLNPTDQATRSFEAPYLAGKKTCAARKPPANFALTVKTGVRVP